MLTEHADVITFDGEYVHKLKTGFVNQYILSRGPCELEALLPWRIAPELRQLGIRFERNTTHLEFADIPLGEFIKHALMRCMLDELARISFCLWIRRPSK
ncbi:hypothetical protein C5167_027819 [Papaver somniferum]|nr:hypothetical protein C5167_027819 [Papaver somniferum]